MLRHADGSSEIRTTQTTPLSYVLSYTVALYLYQSPQGKLHQVEYALEAVKQGSAAIGLRSATHAVLLTLKVSFPALFCRFQRSECCMTHLRLCGYPPAPARSVKH